MTLAHLEHATPRSAKTLVEQYFIGIDNEIATLAESIRALRSRRNSLARISCLPPEILTTVFKHVEEENYSGVYHYPRCLTVTHVCRHWRRVALECPCLWTTINWTSARWIGPMLERSKKSPLVVKYVASTLLLDRLEQALSQLPRIKVLQLHLFQSDADRILVHLLSHPAPLLQNFEFSIIGGSFRLSDAIFQGQAPQLRSLVLANCSFTWTSCLFSGLRALHLEGTPSSLPELLRALGRMPDLERLTLKQLSIISEGSKVSFDRVPLARLKSIVLHATIQTAVAILAHVALPDDTKIVLNLTKIEGPQALSDLFSAMDKGPGKFDFVFRSLRADLSFLSSVVQFSTLMGPSSWEASNDDVQLSIQLHSDSLIGILPPIIFDICRMVTQGPIHSLSLSSSAYLATHFWHAGSAQLPELEEIRLCTSSIESLLNALQNEGTQSTNTAYQSLHALALREVEFQEGEADDLHDIIASRGGLCASLDKLQLMECRGLMADEVELLEEVVENVDWDGIEEPLESESESESGCGCGCPDCGHYDSDEDYL
ncbi:hypothetical protein M405DRAFT_818920 [Rhizopogon salebrosus TDB-379]|nr:hypothetical protein M405DRAFT_818920 [Rhizopogon salebrosus TDB-379]